MTNISIEALKEKTIGEICELVKQAERLPEIPSYLPPYQEPKTQTVQELLDEIENEK